MDDFESVRAWYEQRGIAHRIGFGRRAAIVAVDLTYGFTDPESPLGANCDDVIEQTAKILSVARTTNLAVLFTSIAYENPEAEAGVWALKIPAITTLRYGTRWIEVDQRLTRRQGEAVVYKPFGSAFSGTFLQARLQFAGVDTLILCGLSTSGCIRATAIDAIQHGFRCIVPREAVGDRARLPHEANLFDIDSKYADVLPVDEVCRSLSQAGEETHGSKGGVQS